MKKYTLIISFLIAIFSLSFNTVLAQNDTVYVMKNGSVIWKYKVAEIDSVIFYQPVVVGDNDSTGTFIDSRDNTIYRWLKIGNQVWMAENLKYLPSVVTPGTGSRTVPYYYVYGYDGTNVTAAKATTNYATYGVLYNWTAAMNGAESSNSNPSAVQGVCPSGWHLPSDVEWKQLEMSVGMTEDQANSSGWRGTNEGGKLKEVGTAHWTDPNEGATDEFGFTALPAGYRHNYGYCINIGYHGRWWSATDKDEVNSWARNLEHNNSQVFRFYYDKELGFPVRCVKD
ncbi:MAG: FISUMP domain-containing protein [Salinivirgaceae bacterium]|jgi:uncharacterized protein (TIGR02145 family)|nr:hypothetical protein [Bacteroidales bacterium]